MGRALRAQGGKGEGTEGMFITVPNPITDAVITQVKTKIQRTIEREGRQVTKIIFDFNPKGVPAATSDYGPCITLKNYLLALRLGQISASYPRIHTVAFVHGEVSKHTVLPVLACAEMVMSAEAKIGDVLRGQDGLVPPEVRTAYEKLADNSPAGDVVLKMLNRDLIVRKVKTRDGGMYYWSEATVKDRLAKGELLTVDPEIPPGLGAGNTLFDAELASDLRSEQGQRNNREEVANLYGLSRQSMNEDWLVGRTPVPFRVDISGTLDASKLSSLKRRIASAVRRDANVIVLLAGLRRRRDSGHGLACPLSAGIDRRGRHPANQNDCLCTAEPVAGGRPRSWRWAAPRSSWPPAPTLGDFDYLKRRSDDNLAETRKMLVTLAKEQGYEPLLFEATLRRDLVLYGARSAKHANIHRLITETEKQQQENLPLQQRQWIQEHLIPTRPGEFLKIDAQLAREWGVALHTDVDSRSALNAKYQDYHLEKMRDVPDDWLDRMAEFFREPVVKLLLIMVGIACLILELKIPGIGLPEVLAALCFVLFFWAHSFVGQFTMLAVLLFVLGLILIGVEIFVMPGFGVTGISGILLVVRQPGAGHAGKDAARAAQDWINLGTTLCTFALSLVGAVVAAFIIAWYLPSIPYANRLVLQPPTDEEGGEARRMPGSGLQAPASLLGAIGEAATPLAACRQGPLWRRVPRRDCRGRLHHPGSRVQVIEIEGNRIVVKEV